MVPCEGWAASGNSDGGLCDCPTRPERDTHPVLWDAHPRFKTGIRPCAVASTCRRTFRQVAAELSRAKPRAINVSPMNHKGLVFTPVKGSWVGATAGVVAGAAVGVAVSGSAAGAAGGTVVGGVGGGDLVPVTTGGTTGGDMVVVVVLVVVVLVVVVVASGMQSSMVCWNPRADTKGGPT
jgi:hypothetical protein